MLNLLSSSIQLLFIIFPAFWNPIVGDDCNQGFLSTGWISPPGDLYVVEGSSWEMICVLNTSHPDAAGGTWKNLSFYIDHQLAIPPRVKKYNETAIQLFVENATVSPNYPHDFYGIQCKQNQSLGICVRNVYVGYPPLEVTDFKCISYNWQRLECTWHEPYNPIETTYRLSYQVLFRSRRMTTSCPRPVSSSLQLRFLTRTADASGQQGSCGWDESTQPPYLPTAKTFNFTMAMSNEVGNKTQYIGLINHFAIVIPNRMESLVASEVTSRSARISWKVPDNLKLFPPGLEFRVGYRAYASWMNPDEFFPVDEASDIPWNTNKSVDYALDVELPYANTRYELSVWARSRVANKSDEGFWSTAATVVFQSAADRPCSGPEVSLGSFQVTGSGVDQRSVTLFWSRLPPSCENGPAAGYEITMLNGQRDTMNSINVTSETTSTGFDNLYRDKSYEFILQSYNDVGYSSNSSRLFIPMTNTMPSVPKNVMKIVYNETYFGVQWGASTASRGLSMAAFGRARTDDALAYPSELSNYTVFWCKSTRDFPVTCEGQLFHQDVSASSTSLNITVPDKSNYQFAVAANQGDFSSGLSWSSCIVVANGNGSQVKQVEVISVTSYTIDLAWDLPCSSQNGIITAFNIYCCPVDEADAIDDEEPDCLFGNPNPIQVASNVSRYRIDNLEPYTMYKIVMSVQTQFGEGQSSDPVLNRTAEGRPSVPLDLNLLQVSNQSMSVSWRPPLNPNGASTYYQVYRNNDNSPWLRTEDTKATMEVESYTSYTISVRACNALLCSESSDSIEVISQIGVPGTPGQPSVKSSVENSSCIEIKWVPPTKLAGPTYLSTINITGGGVEHNFTAFGSATERLVESAAVCQPGLELKVRVRTVNQAENGELLMSPWSTEGEYQCKPEGLTLGQILGITFGAALVVLLVVAISFFGRRVHVQKAKARGTVIVMPWENIDGSGGSSGIVKQMANATKDTPGGLGFNSATNHYGRLDSKTNRIGGSPPVIDMKKLHSSNQENPSSEVDCVMDRESRSSGHSSGQDSLSWKQASRSELSSSDSGAEMETPNSPSPDVFVNPPLDPFSKPSMMARSSQNVSDAGADVDRVQFSAVQLRESQQRNGSSAPDLAQQLPNSYVCVGNAPTAGTSTIVPAQNVGYVTLGPSQLACDSAASSPNASPNLSVGSNESLIVKSERDTRPTVKIVPLKRNSAGGSGDYVEACMVAEPAASEIRASTTSPGYVSFKSQEPVEMDRPTTATPVSSLQTNGYVTLGASSAGIAPSANATTSSHYVKLGAQQSNHSLTFV